MYTDCMKKILRSIFGSVIFIGGTTLGFFAWTSPAELWVKISVIFIALAVIAVGIAMIFSPKHIKDALILLSLQ